jgi:hypothetical protein
MRFEDTFGLIKTNVDVHTLGISTIANLLRDCGYKVHISHSKVSEAVINVQAINNFSILQDWILSNNITRLGFSYRLDPQEGKDYFCKLYSQLINYKMFYANGGIIKQVFFAGLPDTCELIQRELGSSVILFPGDESPIESLTKLGIPKKKFPKELTEINEYDRNRWEFAKKVISGERYKTISPQDHLGYPQAGGKYDSLENRLNYCIRKNTLPIIRAHVGPYNPDRLEAVKEFISWEKQLASSGFLDVLSIGSSQLTQSHFGEDWEGLPNGGGVPVNSEIEYALMKEAAKPMLVRTYAGTKNINSLAKMHEKVLNISWHALSFWWFCEIDGRGDNTVFENLKEHIETIRYIASTNKPLEPNVSHHFAFRGSDDISYIISAYLAAKTAKKNGIKHLILQNMLNTPKHTSGLQDIAKGRVMLKLVKTLEDKNFKVTLQMRAGLDYFSPDLEKAKEQLAAVTALMDDIEPHNDNSPEIIHVVSYSEAVRLATPQVINESIQITLSSLKEYREARKKGEVEDLCYNKDLEHRVERLYNEANEGIQILEKTISNLYTPEGLFTVFECGFFPVPYLYNNREKYSHAVSFNTAIKDGGVRVVDEEGNILRTADRFKKILLRYERF